MMIYQYRTGTLKESDGCLNILFLKCVFHFSTFADKAIQPITPKYQKFP